MAPQLIFGTASLGMDWTEFQDEQSVKLLLENLKALGINRLDTAARYPPLNPGRSEQLIGLARELSQDFLVDTKVYTDTKTDGSGDLGSEPIKRSVQASLQRLQTQECVNILYAHRADPATPLVEQIQNFANEIAQGHCKDWGISNTALAVVEDILRICEANGWRKPSCYQGNYNIITRGAELRLLPILRAHGISFVGFGVLASGFVTGKFINGQHQGTRFDMENPLGQISQKIFGSEDLHRLMKEFDKRVKTQGLTPTEVALRWAAHHSALNDADAIIIGASKCAQASEVVTLMRKGPLPDDVLPLVDDLWNALKETRGGIL